MASLLANSEVERATRALMKVDSTEFLSFFWTF